MKNKFVRMFALALGSATLCSVGALQAATHRSEKVTIPFQFHVDKKSMPAGEYRIEQEFGTEMALLVNANTGERVQIIHPAALRRDDRGSLTFIHTGSGYKLR